MGSIVLTLVPAVADRSRMARKLAPKAVPFYKPVKPAAPPKGPMVLTPRMAKAGWTLAPLTLDSLGKAA